MTWQLISVRPSDRNSTKYHWSHPTFTAVEMHYWPDMDRLYYCRRRNNQPNPLYRAKPKMIEAFDAMRAYIALTDQTDFEVDELF